MTGLVSFAHAQEDSTEPHRGTVCHVLIRIGQELQPSAKTGHFRIQSIHTPAAPALAMEE
jgi:hypothetical protein